MDTNYERIYKRLLSDYKARYDYFDQPLPRGFSLYDDLDLFETIQQRIADFKEAQPNQILRPDAEYFLLMNFQQMIALPLLLRADPARPYAVIRDAVSDDVKLVLRGAVEEAKNREISGHSIVQSLNKRWRDLKTTDFRIWDKDEDE